MSFNNEKPSPKTEEGTPNLQQSQQNSYQL